MKFGLSPEQYSILESKLISPLKSKGVKVWIFGSRARGDFKKFSDIDILFETASNLEPSFISSLKESLEESRLIYKVDLVNIQDLASSYRDNVLKDRIEI